MLVKRLLVLIFLVPICAGVITLGGWYLAVFMAALLSVGAWEWAKMFEQGDHQPSRLVLILGVFLIVIARQVDIQFLFEGLLTTTILVAMVVHLVQYERGRDRAATDFTITLSGFLYLGWLGSHFLLLRQLPNGTWWMLLALPAIWLADLGGYLIGKKWGKHKLSHRASPNKSWEGYIGGILFAVVLTPLIALLWQIKAPEVTAWHGLVFGVVISILAPLGDLGESMIKRQFQLKDTSNLLPGHGGILDRIDSWLWAIPLAYYVLIIIR